MALVQSKLDAERRARQAVENERLTDKVCEWRGGPSEGCAWRGGPSEGWPE